jgi:hypothetical protein
MHRGWIDLCTLRGGGDGDGDGETSSRLGMGMRSSSWNGSPSKHIKRQIATPPMPGSCVWRTQWREEWFSPQALGRGSCGRGGPSLFSDCVNPSIRDPTMLLTRTL